MTTSPDAHPARFGLAGRWTNHWETENSAFWECRTHIAARVVSSQRAGVLRGHPTGCDVSRERSIAGDHGGVATVASPVYEQAFDLVTGRCLDDPRITVPVHPVRVADGLLEVGLT